jgi:hypothetical protein
MWWTGERASERFRSSAAEEDTTNDMTQAGHQLIVDLACRGALPLRLGAKGGNMSSSRFGLAILAGLLVWLLASACAPQPQGTPLPGSPSVQATPNCRNALGGQVTRRVGNLLRGPSEEVGIPDIEVRLVDSSGALVARTTTDRDGRYGFHDVCSGKYTVCPGPICPYSPEGPLSRYEPPSHEVSVPPIVQNELDFLETEPPPTRDPNLP